MSFDRRLLELSKKTAAEEERYKKEMEKYAVAFVVLNIQRLTCVTHPASLKDWSSREEAQQGVGGGLGGQGPAQEAQKPPFAKESIPCSTWEERFPKPKDQEFS